MNQKMNALTQALSVASAVGGMARKTVEYQFIGRPQSTVYAHIAHANVTIERTAGPQIILSGMLQPPVAWRTTAEQDEAGVYFVALRRSSLGASLVSAAFTLHVPETLHLILRLENASLTVNAVSGTFELPAGGAGLLALSDGSAP
jgi:hypothetical protein